MKEIVFKDPQTDPAYKNWIAMRLGLGADAFPTACASIGIEEDGFLLAAVVYTNFEIFPGSGRSCVWASIAALPGVNWATRRFLKAIIAYPFEVLGVIVLRTMCAKKNREARRFNEKIGLKRAGVARRTWDGRQDAVHYDLCPYDPAVRKWLGYEPTRWKEAEEEMKEAINGRR